MFASVFRVYSFVRPGSAMAWIVIAGAILIGIVYLMSVLLRLLREYHSETFAALGSPSLFPRGVSVESDWAFTRFLWMSDPRAMGDPRVTRLVWLIRVESALFVAWCLLPLLL